jgi:transcription antitermination factor NusG
MDFDAQTRVPAVSFWAVVQAEAQHEHVVRLLLMRQQFETWMPRIKHHGRIALLFPSYLFVRIVDQFYPVMWTPGVVRLLMAGDKPACLKDEIMASIRKREIGGFVKLPLPNRQLKSGQKVRVIGGSFNGQIGLYQGQTSRDRERVLLELLGQAVPVELPGKDIAPLNIVVSRNAMRY